MSLVQLINHDTIVVKTAFTAIEFEALLFDGLLIEALSIRGDEVMATRPERHFPALLVNDDLRKLEIYAYINRRNIVVYVPNGTDTEYTFAVIHHDGTEYSVGDKILVLKDEDSDGDEPDIHELDQLPLSKLLALFGL